MNNKKIEKHEHMAIFQIKSQQKSINKPGKSKFKGNKVYVCINT